MAVDFLSNEIKVGDTVVFVELGYRNFEIGKIVRITDKTVLIDNKGITTKQFHHQVIVKK
jgi:hypothetical protein